MSATEDGVTDLMADFLRQQGINAVTQISIPTPGTRSQPDLQIENGGTFVGKFSGEFYEGAESAHPGVARQGWILFEVPRTVSNLRVGWSGSQISSREEPVYWRASIDPSDLPDLHEPVIESPEQVEIAESFEFNIKVENSGGGEGELRDSYTLSTPFDGRRERQGLTIFVPPNSTATHPIPYQPRALGEVSLELHDQELAESVEVVPARLNWGEWLKTAINLNFQVSKPVLASEIEFIDHLGDTVTETPETGNQWALIKADFWDDSPEWAPPYKRQFTIVTDGVEYTPTSMGFTSIETFIEPVSGPHYNRETVPGLILFEIDRQLDLEDIEVHVSWTPDLLLEALAVWG